MIDRTGSFFLYIIENTDIVSKAIKKLSALSVRSLVTDRVVKPITGKQVLQGDFKYLI